MNKRVRQVVAITTAAVLLVGCGQKSAADIAKEAEEERAKLQTDFSVNYDGIKTEMIQAGVSVHDPSVLQVDDTYYIYGSHMSAAKSKDLRRWEYVSTIDDGAANGYTEENPVYGKIYQSEDGALKFTGDDDSIIPTDGSGGTRIWAPDVKYSEKAGVYYMYFCTTSSYYASTVCYATSDNPEGPFEWKGNLVYSGLTVDNYKKTDVLDYVDSDYVEKNYLTAGGTYNYKDYPNALDPTIFWDKDGKMWMVYGSWSGGIFLLEIDESTGKVIRPTDTSDPDVDPYYGKRLLGGGHTSIEGPYILYDKASDYYYLYISDGALQRTGGYQIRVYRSKTVDGDYVDMNGKKPEQGSGNPAYFGLKMSGNYMLPSLTQAYMATGHNSAFISSDNKRYIVEHTRFEDRGEIHEPRVHQYFLNEEGWPCMLPYATDGETISEKGYEKSKIVGEYYVVNQGTKIDANIAEPEKWVFTENGYVFGKDVTGTWEQKENSYYVHMTFGIDKADAEEESSDDEKDAKDNKDSFSGVFCEMNDEAGTKVMTFSAVGKNQSIWGVKYDE